MSDATHQPAQSRLLNGNLARSVVALGFVISHCSVVLQGDRLVRQGSETRPLFGASPASGDVYVHDIYLHENPEHEAWTNEFWSSISLMLTGAANLSKLFHGVGSDKNGRDPLAPWVQDQRQALREMLEVGPALGPKSRLVRDALEHVDERLWRRLAAVESGKASSYVVRDASGSRDEWKEDVPEPPLGLYDSGSHTVYFVNQAGAEVGTDLKELVAEASRVRDRATKIRNKLARSAKARRGIVFT